MSDTPAAPAAELPTTDQLIHGFLSTATAIGVSVTVIYGYKKDGGTVTAAAANRKDANIPGALKWLGNADLQATMKAAQALYLHDRLDSTAWEELSQHVQQQHYDRAAAALHAVVAASAVQITQNPS